MTQPDICIYPLARTLEAHQAFKDYIILCKNHTGHTVKRIRTDGAKELTLGQFEPLLASEGILPTTTPPDNHTQNGWLERAHLTILNLVHTYLEVSGLPVSFRAEAANYGVYIGNLVSDTCTQRIPDSTRSGN